MSAAAKNSGATGARRALVLLVVCALSALYLWLALRDMDGRALRAAAAQLSLPLVPVFLLLVAVTLLVRALRIAVTLVRLQPVSLREGARCMLGGYLTSLVLPQPAGEIARITIATRDLGVAPGAAAAAIAIERVFDLLLALLLVAAVTPFATHTDLRLAGALRVLTALAAIGSTLLALAAWSPQRCRAVCAPLFAVLPERVGNWCRQQFEDLLSALQSLMSAHRAPRYVLLALAQTALWAACLGVSLLAAGIVPTFVAVLLTTAMFTLAMLLPAAPGYIGSMQLAYIVALVPLGVPLPQAFAASLYTHVLFNLFVLIAGVLVLRSRAP